MLNFKRFGKIMVCLLCCVACLAFVNPVSALSAVDANGTNTPVPELPTLTLGTPVTGGHLASVVRYSASYGSMSIGNLENGTKLTVLGTKGSFYKIDCYDMVGYIAKSQVTQDAEGNYFVSADESSSESVRMNSYTMQQAMELKSQLVTLSQKYIGVPYVWGGTTPRGFDCSGFTQYVYSQAGIGINRTAANQLSSGVIVAKEDLQPGDLVTFSNTGGRGFASHVGMYLGNGKLIHASSTKGIVVVDLDSTYFAEHYQCARRVILTDVAVAVSIPTVGSIAGSMGSGWRTEG